MSVICFMQLRDFLSPEGFDNGVLYSQENLMAELRIGEEAVHAAKIFHIPCGSIKPLLCCGERATGVTGGGLGVIGGTAKR